MLAVSTHTGLDLAMELLAMLSLNKASADDIAYDLGALAGRPVAGTEIVSLVWELHERGYAVVAERRHGLTKPVTHMYLSTRNIARARRDAEAYMDSIAGKWN
jgi:hypothetical protein